MIWHDNCVLMCQVNIKPFNKGFMELSKIAS